MKLSTFSRALPLVVLAPFVALSSATDDGGQKLFPHGTPPGESNRFIVEYDTDNARQAAKNQANKVFLELPNRKAVVVQVKNPQALVGIANTPGVKSIEEDALRYVSGVASVRGRGGTRPSSLESFAEDLLKSTGNSNNSEKNEPRDLKATSQQQAHRRLAEVTPYGIGMVQADPSNGGLSPPAAGPNKMVCIIDSGYDGTHEDLPTTANGSDDSGSGAWYDDTCSHGTHVAGTIAAVGNNGVGVVGVFPNANLYIVKVFDGAGCGWSYSSSLVAALDDCVANGANIVSMSLGGSRSVRTEKNAFNDAYAAGVLSIAAAGNGGNTQHSYPASYDGVVSVAALDSAKVIADFSQQTDQVELAAPGVAVRSTVKSGAGFDESVSVGGTGYEVTAMQDSPDMSNGPHALFRCNAVDGLGSPGDCAGATNQVCLIKRGDITFAEKVQECQAQGGVGAIIFNNALALFSGTLGGVSTGIPSVGMSGTDGATLEGMITSGADVFTVVTTTTNGNYAFYDGTSMATPHVSGVAALVWSHHPTCSASDIRDALAATAMDLGVPGKDNAYGWGLVQAKGAVDCLTNNGCGGCVPGGGGGGGCDLLQAGSGCNVDSECCSGSCKGQPGGKTCK